MATTQHDGEFAERLRSLRFEELPDYLTITEAATYLRKAVKTLYAWKLRGIGPRAVRVDHNLLYSREEIAAYLKEETRKQLAGK